MENFRPNIGKKIADELDPSTKAYRDELANKLAKVRNISADAARAYLERTQDTEEYKQALLEVQFSRGHSINLKNKVLESQADVATAQQKLNEAMDKFGNTSRCESLKEEPSVKQALEIMGESQFIGPEDIKNTFGFQPDTIPEIPFSPEELERAKELGQQLILYVDSKEDGSAFTVQSMKEILPEETTDGGTFFYNYNDWYENDEVANKETPRAGWRLTTSEIIESSTSKNYLGQTQELVNYLQNEVFAEEDVPEVYQEAIDEFNAINTSDFKEKVRSYTTSEWQEAARTLSELKINQITRESFTEVLYRLAVQEKKSGNKNLVSQYSWSNSLDSEGRLVSVGTFDSAGVHVHGWIPAGSFGDAGVCFSRSV